MFVKQLQVDTGNATTTTFEVGNNATEGHIDLLSDTSIKISDFDSLSSRWNGFKHADKLQIVYKNVKEFLDKPQFEIVDSTDTAMGLPIRQKLLLSLLIQTLTDFQMIQICLTNLLVAQILYSLNSTQIWMAIHTKDQPNLKF